MYLSHEIAIDRSPEEVFYFTHSAENLTIWYTGVKSVEVLPGDSLWPEKGGQLKAHFRLGAYPFDLICTVTTYKPGKEMSFTVEGQMMGGSQQWLYSRQGDSTLLKAIWDYRFPLGKVGEGIYMAFEKDGAFQTQTALVNLKQAIEST